MSLMFLLLFFLCTCCSAVSLCAECSGPSNQRYGCKIGSVVDNNREISGNVVFVKAILADFDQSGVPQFRDDTLRAVSLQHADCFGPSNQRYGCNIGFVEDNNGEISKNVNDVVYDHAPQFGDDTLRAVSLQRAECFGSSTQRYGCNIGSVEDNNGEIRENIDVV